jgi:hypothetical protein
VAGDDRGVIAFFTIPKPFAGHIGVIQRNAVASWTRLGDVLLFGDEHGVAEAAAETGARHVPEIALNEHGTPLLSDAFAQAERLTDAGTLCFVNADIVLMRDVADAAARVEPPSLLVGESWNVDMPEPLEFDASWEARVRALPRRRRGADAIDWFVYSRGLYHDMPPFAIGRTAFDNWLIWKARESGATVVDATPVVLALHQGHDYAHAGSLEQIRSGPEAARNRELAGGKSQLFSRFDATHRLTRRGLVPNPLAWRRVGEKTRRALYKLRHRVLLRPAA